MIFAYGLICLFAFFMAQFSTKDLSVLAPLHVMLLQFPTNDFHVSFHVIAVADQ